MALNRYKLGSLIELCEEKNDNLEYTIDDVKGISIQKVFIETKANMDGVSLKPYYLVKPNEFAYVTVTSRNSEKITIAHNETDKTYIVSSSYIVFKVKNEDVLDSDYLLMYFNRPEFDRYARFNSWGSARETFQWQDLCDVEIDLPSIDIQKKYVNIFNGLKKNRDCYANGLEDLKLVCDMMIENLRKNNPITLTGHLIESFKKNTDMVSTIEKGISIQKKFIETKAQSSDITSQKLVPTSYFAFNSNTSRNSDTLSIALNKEKTCIVSNTYVVFSCDDHFLPDYLYMWFKRKEFDRYARFNSWGSARETINLSDIESYTIGDASIDIQNDIVNILNTLEVRNKYLEILNNNLKIICPILIKGSIIDGVREV